MGAGSWRLGGFPSSRLSLFLLLLLTCSQQGCRVSAHEYEGSPTETGTGRGAESLLYLTTAPPPLLRSTPAHLGSDLHTDTAQRSRETLHLASDSSDLNTDTQDRGRETLHLAAESTDFSTDTALLAADTGHLAAESTDLDTDSSHLSRESVHLSADSVHLAAESTDLNTDTAPLAAESTDLNTDTAPLAAESTDFNTDTAPLAADTAHLSTPGPPRPNSNISSIISTGEPQVRDRSAMSEPTGVTGDNSTQVVTGNHTGVNCVSLLPPRSGSFSVEQGSGVSLGSVLAFWCRQGYQLVGNERITCTLTAEEPQWSHYPPTCEAIPIPVDRGLRVAVMASVVSSVVIVFMSLSFIACCLQERLNKNSSREGRRNSSRRSSSRHSDCWLDREDGVGEWESYPPPKIFHLSPRYDPPYTHTPTHTSPVYLGGLGYDNRGYHRSQESLLKVPVGAVPVGGLFRAEGAAGALGGHMGGALGGHMGGHQMTYSHMVLQRVPTPTAPPHHATSSSSSPSSSSAAGGARGGAAGPSAPTPAPHPMYLHLQQHQTPPDRPSSSSGSGAAYLQKGAYSASSPSSTPHRMWQ